MPDLNVLLMRCLRVAQLLADHRGPCRDPSERENCRACREMQRWRSLRPSQPAPEERNASSVLKGARPCRPSEPFCITKDGMGIRFDNRSGVADFFLKSYQSWDPGLIAVLARFLRPGKSLLLDVGAWVGPATLWAAKVARRVVALEPSLAAFATLQLNIEQNVDLRGRVHAENVALGVASTEAWFSNRADSMDSVVPGPCSGCVRVPVVTIEDLLRRVPELDEVDFVKIDAEGSEAALVPALLPFLSSRKPTVLVAFHPTLAPVPELLVAARALHKLCPFLYDSRLQPWIPPRENESFPTADVVCLWRPVSGPA